MSVTGYGRLTVTGPDDIERSFAEHYDTIRDVEDDPTGAHAAIQKLSEALDGAARDTETAILTEYKKLIDWNPKKGDRFVDEVGDVIICDTNETARWSTWNEEALSAPFVSFTASEVKPEPKPIGTITDVEEIPRGGLRVSYNPLTQKGRITFGETPAPDDYAPLLAVLDAAYEQAASGKGKERHANDKPFDRQPLLEISRMAGIGGPAYQVMKKTQEAVGMFNRGLHAAARAEMLGAINYAAAMVMLIDD